MNGTISREENDLVSGLKHDGTLQRFSPASLAGITRNGGVAIICSDGDIDAPNFHTNLSPRPHCLRVFGGALLFARSFKEEFSGAFANCLLTNLKKGMEVKATRTLFLYFHAPCGMAVMHNYGIRDQLRFASEARSYFAEDPFFIAERIHTLFHVKRINRAGDLEQNTYRIVLDEMPAE